MSSISFALVKKNGSFVPSHISEIMTGDIFYLVIDGSAGNQLLKATDEPKKNSVGEWVLSSIECSESSSE